MCDAHNYYLSATCPSDSGQIVITALELLLESCGQPDFHNVGRLISDRCHWSASSTLYDPELFAAPTLCNTTTVYKLRSR